MRDGSEGQERKMEMITRKDWPVIMLYAVVGIMAMAFAAFVVLIAYCWVVYGSSPIDEIPAWALAFMFGKRR